ncbi:12234_t:CDS:1, partial [Dentiscutata heterogama]
QSCANIAKELILHNIYLSKVELKKAAEEYMVESESEFYENMNNKQWNIYYKNKLTLP